MIFDILWTILIGVIGGIISSLIVSRVFFIQAEYQQQVKYVEQIIRKVGGVSAYFSSAKAVFEVSYDQDIEMEHEMKKKGYHTEDEYYAANNDRDWISKSALLATFLNEMKRTARLVADDIANCDIEDSQLSLIIDEISEYLYGVSAIREFTFAAINENKKKEQNFFSHFDSYKHITSKQLIKLVVKDKVMILLFVIIGLLVAGTFAAYLCGI